MSETTPSPPSHAPQPQSAKPGRWPRLKAWIIRHRVALIVFLLGVIVALLIPEQWIYVPEHDAAVHDEHEWLYACPMHPYIQSHDPDATCPECGMNLELVRDTDVLDEHDQWMIGLSMTQVKQHPLMERIRVLGRLRIDETQLGHVAAWVEGRIETLYANTRGEEIRKGEPLLTLYSPQLYAAQEEYFSNLKAAREATGPGRQSLEALVASARQRLLLLGLSEEQVEAIPEEGPQHTLTIPAPQDGVIVERHVEEGDYVAEGTRVVTVADLRTLWLFLDVHERDSTLVRKGQRVRITAEALPGYVGHGWIDFIEPFVDERSRTKRVRVTLPNVAEPRRFKPGMFVTAEVEVMLDEELEPAIDEAGEPTEPAPHRVLPTSAILDAGERTVVYLLASDTEEGKTFELREVTVGPRLRRADEPEEATRYRPILSGLATGDVVALGGAFLLDSQAQIRGRPSLFFPEGEAAAPEDHEEHVH